jgi:cytochrome c-type biogenesis protein CcmE
MTPRRKRMIGIAVAFVGVALATVVAIQAFQENMLYFYSPTQILEGEAPDGKTLRLGGLVETGSVTRIPGELEVRFMVSDLNNRIEVAYAGVLPDLFREGQGVIAIGEIEEGGVFRANEVLAKHDENYMPPEVADMLKEQGHPMDDAASTEPPASAE